MPKPSLAARNALVPAEVTTGLAVFDAPQPEIADTSESTAYVTFIYARSKLWPQLCVQIPGIREGDVVYVPPKPGSPVRLDPFRFFYLTGRQYGFQADSEGNMTAAKLSAPERGDGFKEAIEAVVMAFLPDGTLAPARVTFKTTKCPAAKTAASALRQAGTAEWADLSPAHADSLKMPRPALRFTVEARVRKRTARSTGNAYDQADGVVRPSVAADWKALAEFFDANGAAELTRVYEAYERRVEEIAALASK